jgi:hypothetical protein
MGRSEGKVRREMGFRNHGLTATTAATTAIDQHVADAGGTNSPNAIFLRIGHRRANNPTARVIDRRLLPLVASPPTTLPRAS